jgi:chloride channel protein, CIC family
MPSGPNVQEPPASNGPSGSDGKEMSGLGANEQLAHTRSPVSPPSPRALLKGRGAWRQLASWAGGHINGLSYLPRWLILATFIGVVAGLGAVAFYEALTRATQLFLGIIAGYHVPTPAGEGFSLGSAHYARPWAIPLVVVLGALLSGFLVFTWAPEASGHGTDAAIDAVHHNPRGIRLRAVVVKLVASALTIGSGGSGGREGPTAQISGGFGSLLARVLDLPTDDGRVAVSVGIGSGIGAIFSAPLGGAVLAAEVVYRNDFEYAAFLPGFFASIVAYAIFGAVFGYHPLFASAAYHFTQPIQLVWFGIIGFLAGGVGLLYSKGFYGVKNLSHRLPFSRMLRPAVGALFVGLIALGLPEVLGTGYGWIQEAISNDLLHTPLWIVLLLPFARIAATAFSIGTGGSGGVFGPGMVIGAFTGLAVWRILEPIGVIGVGHDPSPFIVVGMMAVFGSISRAPLAVMVMVAEMTGNIGILAPAIVAVALATFIVSLNGDSIYRSQLRNRDDSEASRLQFGVPLLSLARVDQVMKPPRVVLPDSMSVNDALDELHSTAVPGAPVVDGENLYLGTVSVDRLERVASSDGQSPVASVVDATTTTVQTTTRLNEALASLIQADGKWVTVTSSRQVIGILSVSDVMTGYHQALVASAGKVSEVSRDADILEERVGGGSPLVGVGLRDAELPPGCIVVSIQRDHEMLFATGSTRLERGDIVTALANPTTAEALRRMIRATDEPRPPMVERGRHMV